MRLSSFEFELRIGNATPAMLEASDLLMSRHRLGWLDLFDSYWLKRWKRLYNLRECWQQKGLDHG